jgi:hypothetical protein
MAGLDVIENRVAVYTNWAFFGSFGFCFALSGFASSNLLTGLAGYAALMLGFGAHIVINAIFKTSFSKGEVALGLIAFALSVLGFIGSWIFDPSFTMVNGVIGLAGFSAILACFIAYIVMKYGLRGSFTLIHRMREH